MDRGERRGARAGGVSGRRGAAPGHEAVGAHQHGAVGPDAAVAQPRAARVEQIAVEVPDADGVDRQPVLAGQRVGGRAPRLPLLAGDEQEPPGRHEVLDRAPGAVLVVDPGVGERGAGPGGGLVDPDLVDRLGGRRSVRDDRGRVVRVAVLDVELPELHRLRAHQPQHLAAQLGVLGPPAPDPLQAGEVLLGALLRRDADRLHDDQVVDGVLERALAVAGHRRAPLGLVGAEQAGLGLAVQDGGELPAQVVHVLHGAGEAQPAGRGMTVGRVADEEHAVHLEGGGQDRLHRPAGDAVDLHGRVGQAHAPAHVGLDLLVGERARVVHEVVEVDDPLLGVGAPARRAHRGQHDAGAGLRREHPAQEDVGVAEVVGEVHRHVHRGRLADHAKPLVGHAELLGDGAAAVGGDEVAGPDAVLPAGVLVADQDGDAAVVLLQLQQLVVEPDAARGELLRPFLHQRLQADLRQVELVPGAGRAPLLVVAAGAPRLDLGQAAAEVLAGAGDAGVERRVPQPRGRRAVRGDRVGHAGVLQDLHRALVEHVRLGQVRGRRERADEQVVDVEAGQQHRRGEAGASTADDEDVDGLVVAGSGGGAGRGGHRGSPLSSGTTIGADATEVEQAGQGGPDARPSRPRSAARCPTIRRWPPAAT